MSSCVRYALLLSFLIGCGGPGLLQRRFMNEFHCDEVPEYRSLEAGAYDVWGCGHYVRYICGGRACVAEPEMRRAPARERLMVGDARVDEARTRTPHEIQRSGVSMEAGELRGHPGVRLIAQRPHVRVTLVALQGGSRIQVRAHSRGETCNDVAVGGIRATGEPNGAPTIPLNALHQLEPREYAFQACGHSFALHFSERSTFEEYLQEAGRLSAMEPPAPVVSEEAYGWGTEGPQDGDPIEVPRDDRDIRQQIDALRSSIELCGMPFPAMIELVWREGEVFQVRFAESAGESSRSCATELLLRLDVDGEGTIRHVLPAH